MLEDSRSLPRMAGSTKEPRNVLERSAAGDLLLETTMAGVLLLMVRWAHLNAAREARTPCMQPLTEPHAGQLD